MTCALVHEIEVEVTSWRSDLHIHEKSTLRKLRVHVVLRGINRPWHQCGFLHRVDSTEPTLAPHQDATAIRSSTHHCPFTCRSVEQRENGEEDSSHLGLELRL